MSDDAAVYAIPTENVPKFLAAMEKLSRRYHRLFGADAPPVFSFTLAQARLVQSGAHAARRVQDVTLRADPVRISGWDFVATLDHGNEAGNILRCVPGIRLPEKYRSSPPSCDHCGVNRYRRDTYVVRHFETGEHKQVGRTCLHDFFGHDPHRFASLAEILSRVGEIAEGFSSFGSSQGDFLEIEYLLAHCAIPARRSGYVSRAKADPDARLFATVDVAMSNLSCLHDSRSRKYYEAPTDTDYAYAAVALNWARDEAPKRLSSDYWYNVSIAISGEFVSRRNAGIVASIFSGYQQFVEQRLTAKATRPSQFVGAKGERVEVEAVVLELKPMAAGAYGPRTLCRFKTAEGDILVWFANAKIAFSVSELVKLRGTVLDHKEYHGVNQTTLGRCKVAAK